MALSRDAHLVARARRGSDAAFERLYSRHQPAILSFCRHLTGNREDAEDAVQHTFLAAYRRIMGSDDDQLELRPWLFVVARNRCLSLLRARRELAAPALDADRPVFDGLSAEVERREDLRDLVRDMARLPEPQRAALVLSQLDALDYREIGTVLDVGPEKVKALVFQARSTLASAREAREAPCLDIRREIATARGPALRRRLLRRHVGQCDGCSEFEQTVLRQRRDLGALLPVVPSAGLGQAVLDGALGREAAAAGSAGGTGAAAVGGGGAAAGSSGLAGTLSLIGAGGAAKVAVVAVAVGGGTAGAVAADLPARIDAAVPSIGSTQRSGGDPGSGSMAPGGTGNSGGDAPDAGERTASDRGAAGGRRQGSGRRGTAAPGAVGAGREDGAAGPHADEGGSGAHSGGGSTGGGGSGGGGGGPSGSPPGSQPGDDLPPGLAKRDELPPGLRRRDGLPPGLAKRDGAPPGRSGGSPGASNGRGRGAAPGQGNGGGQSNGGSQGNGNAGAPANGGGQGNGGGSPGNSGGNGNGHGNSGGGPATPGPSQGGGPPGGQGNPGGGQGNGNPSGQGGGNGSPGQGNGNGNGGNPH